MEDLIIVTAGEWTKGCGLTSESRQQILEIANDISNDVTDAHKVFVLSTRSPDAFASAVVIENSLLVPMTRTSSLDVLDCSDEEGSKVVDYIKSHKKRNHLLILVLSAKNAFDILYMYVKRVHDHEIVPFEPIPGQILLRDEICIGSHPPKLKHLRR